ERYPSCSQLITQNRIPEFDNLYLDMNGIVHNCSHANNDSAHFRVTEEQIWIGIFNYIDHLFVKIKPKKLFYMAIDGVAPRAKMNQQRSRRFRTAKDAEETRRKAVAKGEELPEEDPFDSNCITPGTEFMEKLTIQLKYFINKKVSEDANWRDIEIILSGPETPGEGEHKIMEYIRTTKAQPGYNPNTRHCLYGLDADLIMLGLVSHDPHFALLREEVTFGRASKHEKSIDTQNFYLMHLSILREYLDHEFSSLKSTLKFQYDLEKIIDDFILLALFVGNDFLPHLPNLHIGEGALGLMFGVYKKVFPTLDGYINNEGVLDNRRLEVLLHELAEQFEKERYEAEMIDVQFLRSKQGHRKDKAKSRDVEESLGDLTISNGRNTMTPHQNEIYQKVKEFILERPATPQGGHSQNALHFLENYSAQDRHFVERIARDLGLHFAVQYSTTNDEKHIYIEIPGLGDTEDTEESEDEEAIEARQRVMKKYDNAKITEEASIRSVSQERREMDEHFQDWKRQYYWEKMRIDIDNPKDMQPLVYAYVEGLQWVLFYYYRGVASWGWFYPYYYSPKISDLKNLTQFNPVFELGTPFRPFEQLMGVLPSLSRKLLPLAYRDLMTDPTSPIIDFYPTDFELDMNGKKQDWEAVVKVPFIEEKRLLETMKSRSSRLTEQEKKRNQFGESLLFVYDKEADLVNGNANDNLGRVYPSSLPGVFPDVYHCKSKMVTYRLPHMEGLKFNNGLCKGARLGADMLAGFPTLQTLPHTATLQFHGVNVFQMDSKNESMVIRLLTQDQHSRTEDAANALLGKRIFVGWPFLQEALVVCVSDELFRYELKKVQRSQEVIRSPQQAENIQYWRKRADRLETVYSKRFATEIGHVEVVVHVLMLKGMKRLDNGALVKEYMPRTQQSEFALQTIVRDGVSEDPRHKEQPPTPINLEFPIGAQVFFLGGFHYGAPATVESHSTKTVTIKMIVSNQQAGAEPDIGNIVAHREEVSMRYYPSYVVNKQLQISALALSKLTASLHVVSKTADQRLNLGLNLKFEAKQQKVLGYTRKSADGNWQYSQKAVDLLQEYKSRFPEFVNGLEKRSKNDFYEPADFYDASIAEKKINDIRDWLKSKGVKDFERVPLDAQQLSKNAIKEIEDAANALVAKPNKYSQIIIKNIPRQVLLKPSYAVHKLQDQEFALGDRVVFVEDAGTVPIAAKGVVVGIQGKAIEVVFDNSFMGGVTMGGRCSQYRGMTVMAHSILNLTNKQYASQPVATGGKSGDANPMTLKHQRPVSQLPSTAPSRGPAHHPNPRGQGHSVRPTQSHDTLQILNRGAHQGRSRASPAHRGDSQGGRGDSQGSRGRGINHAQ
ncbi:hypothetical protein BZG36_02847, partial [Bifiguratus adelaidae]